MINMRKINLALLLICFTTLTFGQTELQNLTVESLSNPIGIDIKTPRFSWQLVSKVRDTKQTAYEIEVKEGNKTVWSSGKVATEKSIFNKYAGSPLVSNEKYTWKVRVWDNRGRSSKWANATFGTSFLNASD